MPTTFTPHATPRQCCRAKDFIADGEVAATLIKVDDPYATLAQLLRMVEDMKPKPAGVEQPVYVSEGVELPEGIYLGAFAYVGKNVKLGRNVKNIYQRPI